MPCSFTTGSRFRDCFAEDRLGQFATEGDWIRHTRNAALNLAAAFRAERLCLSGNAKIIEAAPPARIGGVAS